MTDRLEDLTEEQRRAVTHKDGPLLVLAGAGTGKTRVITRRIAELVHSGVRADRVLAITFTNKAAGEMRERTRELVGDAPVVSTFHSFGARFLRRNAARADLGPSFTIYDDTDQIAIMKEAMEEARVDPDAWPARFLMTEVSRVRNKGVDPDTFTEEAIGPKAQAVAAVYPAYLELLRSRNGVDFDDLLILPVELFERDEELCAMWSEWFQYILIDEYQDTNAIQYRLARCLASAHRNLCVTGDPDQAIYGWRGADIANILDFEKDYPDATVVTLTNNFRSTQPILDAANKLIAFNTRRKEKSLVGVTSDGENASTDLTVREFASAQEEAFFVARRVQELRAAGVGLSDIAVLYRANFQSRLVEEAFVHRGLPYIVVGAVAFYQRREVKDLLAWLRVLDNPHDDFAAQRIINIPPRRIGATTVRRVTEYRRRHNISLYEAAGRARDIEALAPRAQKAVLAWRELVDELRDGRDERVELVLHDLIDSVNYRAWLEKAYPEEVDRIENVVALCEAAREFDLDIRTRTPEPEHATALLGARDGLMPGVTGFLEHVALVSAVDDLEDQRDRVSLMTVHTAKGLEFECCFLIGWEDGVFPNSRSVEESQTGLEEERRLAYVAITRAKRRLSVSWARTRSKWGQFEFNDPSPFIFEAGLSNEEPKSRRRRAWFTDDDDSSQIPRGWDDEHQQQHADEDHAPPAEEAAGEGSRLRRKVPKAVEAASGSGASRERWRKLLGQARDERGAGQGERGRKARGPRVRPRRVPSITESAAEAGLSFAAGDRVRHEHFGLGDVCSVSGSGVGTRVRVRFARHGEKTLVLQYARLEKVNE